MCPWVRLRRQGTIVVIAKHHLDPIGLRYFSHRLYLHTFTNLTNFLCQTRIKNCWVIKISQSTFWLIWWSDFFWCLVFSDGHRYPEIKKTLRIMWFNLLGKVEVLAQLPCQRFIQVGFNTYGARKSMSYSKHSPFDFWTALVIRTLSLYWAELFLFVTNFYTPVIVQSSTAKEYIKSHFYVTVFQILSYSSCFPSFIFSRKNIYFDYSSQNIDKTFPSHSLSTKLVIEGNTPFKYGVKADQSILA